MTQQFTALVTGAGSGIGRATAVHLAALGHAVVVADVDEEGGRATVAQIESSAGAASFVVADIAEEPAVQAMVEYAVTTYGRLDLAVNNAGVAHAPTDLHELPAEDFDRVIAVDLRGTFLCLKHEIAAMLATGGGRIVNVASNAGVKNAPAMAGYTAAKHGVVGLTKNVALQYARRGIRLNAICPGTVLTEGLAGYPEEHQAHWREMVPTGRLGRPEDIAAIIAFLLSDDAEMMQAALVLADGGLMYA
ncbi:SDR family NAD(P)-dependent oxidoreductase [Nocardia jinanensis]|uniref:Short chain dehydrogenase n=1 Tax=Nocardia jinanensis TaxID=382504 RepID=A0A917RYA6_9NOCA|nr:glucose 1-dehydrogenase [Nocardia jinanensis]GGL41864.1 short chain dehydrogenase [Nocardia jinanensis]